MHNEPWIVGDPPGSPTVCLACGDTAFVVLARDTCVRCEAPINRISRQEYTQRRDRGQLFIYIGPKKLKGPPICPECGRRTIRRYLEEHKACARCVKEGKKSGKQESPVLEGKNASEAVDGS